MVKQLKVQLKWSLLSALFLVTPMSIEYWNIVTYGGYYIIFIAAFFCCIGFFIKLASHTDAEKPKTRLRIDFFLFLLLSFALGIQGIRSLLVVHIPLLIACAYLWPLKKKSPFFLGCCGFAACCAGYAVNWLMHIKYSFHSYGSMRMENLSANFFSKLSRCLANLAVFFGFSGGSNFFSIRGFFSVAAIIVTFILFRITIKITRHAHLQNNKTEMSQEQLFMPGFFLCSVSFNIFVFVTVNQPVIERYFLPFMVLYIPLTAILFAYAEKTYGYLKRRAVICVIALFVIGGGCANFQSMAANDKNATRKGYIQYLLDNELGYGFATHWNANVTTELSNGRIELAGLDPRIRSGANGNPFRIFESLIPKKFFDPFYHRGESFLLLKREEWDLVRRGDFFREREADYQDKDFFIFKFPSAEIIHFELLYM